MTKYNEIISRVSVTPEMHERILKNVIAHKKEKEKSAVSKKTGTRRLMRWLPAAVAACFLIVIGMQVYHVNQPDIDTTTESIIEYASLAELEEATGIDMPEIVPLPFEVDETAYTDSFGIARVDYYGKNGENITLSKAKDTGTDVSGIYNKYTSVTEKELEGVTVTLKGNDGTIALATWTKDGYACALYVDPGVSVKSMQDMLISALD